MVNYNKGKIYKIISGQTNIIYIGSTTQQLCRRKAVHVAEIKNNKNTNSREILQYDDSRIILIELFPCNSKDELSAREQFHIEQNKNICCNNWPVESKINKDKFDKIACDYCGKEYTAKYYKSRHIKSAFHKKNVNIKTNGDNPIKKFNCLVCDYTTKYKHCLARHEAKKHNK